jgi:tetrahydromethanopterin S-methyltransferase subunit G
MDDLTKQIDKRLDKQEAKLDQVIDTLSRIDSTLAAQHESLEDHIRRTNVAEENIDLIRKDLKPIQNHVSMVKGAMKLIGVVCAIVGAIAAVAAVFH